MEQFSIVTIVKARRPQLRNLLESIRMSVLLPRDIQIVFMDDVGDFAVPEGLRVNVIGLKNEGNLPLAAARNRGIQSAETQNVIFIDVDCIVSPTLFGQMLAHLHDNTIVAAYPLYLPVLPPNGSYHKLVGLAVPHPSRENIPPLQPVDHLWFWSLIFAVNKNTFEYIGGFDEKFTGYGAEDTDFAMSFHAKGIEQIFVKDFILHQYHEKYNPPINHFYSIIQNARRYFEKWHTLPMQRWLKAFEDLGLIKIGKDRNIEILQQPIEEQIKKCFSKEPY